MPLVPGNLAVWNDMAFTLHKTGALCGGDDNQQKQQGAGLYITK